MGLFIRLVTIGALLLTVFGLGFFAGGEFALAGIFPNALRFPGGDMWVIVVWPLCLSLFTGIWVSVVMGRRNFFDNHVEEARYSLLKLTSFGYQIRADTGFSVLPPLKREQAKAECDEVFLVAATRLGRKGFENCYEVLLPIHRQMTTRVIEDVYDNFFPMETKEHWEIFMDWRKAACDRIDNIEFPVAAYLPWPMRDRTLQ